MQPKLFQKSRQLMNNPKRVLLFCIAFALTSLLLNGTFIRLWGLYMDHSRIQSEIIATYKDIQNLQYQLRQAKDPQFIEKQARDKLDYADEQDLVFVFAEQ